MRFRRPESRCCATGLALPMGLGGFVRAEKADVVPLIERMVRIQPRYLK